MLLLMRGIIWLVVCYPRSCDTWALFYRSMLLCAHSLHYSSTCSLLSCQEYAEQGRSDSRDRGSRQLPQGPRKAQGWSGPRLLCPPRPLSLGTDLGRRQLDFIVTLEVRNYWMYLTWKQMPASYFTLKLILRYLFSIYDTQHCATT